MHPTASDRHNARQKWFVAHVLTGREKAAERHLRNQGFETFAPHELRTVRHARRLHSKEKAFFPGYLFIRFDPARDRWRSINGTRGVRTLIMQAERPVPCPQDLIERLIETSDENGIIDMSSRLTFGQKVKVRSGPFADLVGTMQGLDASGRARVLLQIMSGQILSRMDVKAIEAL